MSKGVERAFERLGFQVDTISCVRSGSEWDEVNSLEYDLRSRIDKNIYDAAFSVNFNPQVSAVCEQKGLCYISWINDSPLYIRDINAMRRTCNRLFTFDRGYVKEYRDQGMPFFHMPLGVDTTVFDQTIDSCSSETIHKYQSEVSMVGNLYATKYNNLIRPLSPQVTDLLEQMIRIQQKVSDRSIFSEALTDGFIAQMNQEYRQAGIDFSVDRAGLEFLLLSEVTGRERKLFPALLARQHDVHVYSTDTFPIPGVHMEGAVDYYTQMPLVFNHSRINLNITLRTIRTGIPLRALDVLGCGGFLVTNAQEEILEHFRDAKELVVFHSLEELFDKVQWYLNHETERAQIAQAGFEHVKQHFSFDQQILKMISIAFSS